VFACVCPFSRRIHQFLHLWCIRCRMFPRQFLQSVYESADNDLMQVLTRLSCYYRKGFYIYVARLLPYKFPISTYVCVLVLSLSGHVMSSYPSPPSYFNCLDSAAKVIQMASARRHHVLCVCECAVPSHSIGSRSSAGCHDHCYDDRITHLFSHSLHCLDFLGLSRPVISFGVRAWNFPLIS
jgi:hypothetical protein